MSAPLNTNSNTSKNDPGVVSSGAAWSQQELLLILNWFGALRSDLQSSTNAEVKRTFHSMTGETDREFGLRIKKVFQEIDAVINAVTSYGKEKATLNGSVIHLEGEVLAKLEKIQPLFRTLHLTNTALIEIINGISLLKSCWSDGEFDVDRFRSRASEYCLPARMITTIETLCSQGWVKAIKPLSQFQLLIKENFERLRSELIDTNLQANRALSWRESRNNLSCREVAANTLFHSLVTERGALELSGLASANDAVTTEISDTETKGIAGVHVECSQSELIDRLGDIAQDAENNFQNRGDTGLRIGIGMLEWRSKDTEEQPRFAPLIFVPVGLHQKNLNSAFFLSHSGEEVEDNSPLRKRLRDEFGILLDKYEAGTSLDEHFDQIAAAVSSNPDFVVHRYRAVLGFFQTGLRKYDDAGHFKPWKGNLSSAAAGLLGTGFNDPVPRCADGRNVEKAVSELRLREVMGCDASQLSAVINVMDGFNTAVQGPPGSGKSHAIAETIIQAVQAGKSVLFTAAKRAPLEVVYSRLAAAGLGEVALLVSSHNITRRDIINELRRTVQAGEPEKVDGQQIREELRKVALKLDEYVKAISIPINKSGMNAYDACGRLLNLPSSSFAVLSPKLSAVSENELQRLLSLTRDIQALCEKSGLPINNAYSLARLTEVSEEFLEKAASKISSCSSQGKAIALLVESIKPLNLLSVRPIEDLTKVCGIVRTVITFWDAHGENALADTKITELVSRSGELVELANRGKRYQELTKKYSGAASEVWNTDLTSLIGTLEDYKNAWWLPVLFSARYRQAMSQSNRLLGAYIPKNYSDRINALKELKEGIALKDSILEAGKGLSPLLGRNWKELNSNWQLIGDLSGFCSAAGSITAGGSKECILEILSGGEKVAPKLREIIPDLVDKLSVYSREVAELFGSLKAESPTEFSKRYSISQFEQLLQAMADRPEDLEGIVEFNRLALEFDKAGHSEITKAIRVFGGDLSDLPFGLERSRLNSIKDEAYTLYPALRNFSRAEHELLMSHFSDLDLKVLDMNARHIARECWERIPRIATGGENGVIVREILKTGGHRGLAEIMDRAPNAIKNIKQVFLFTPEALAAFCPAQTGLFDIWITDEASQQLESDGLGALMRTRQLMVVGDKMQMGPSRSFKKGGYQGVSSLLERCEANNAPGVMFTSIRRFRGDELIRCSGVLFYGDKLQAPPAPRTGTKEVGLFYRKHAHVYETGGQNSGEAREVALAAIEHAKNNPEHSLGIAAFSDEQSRLIRRQIDELRRLENDPRVEQFFLNSSHAEMPFFVKPLEQVQGDERDVIFVSTAYGPQADGKFRLNLSPNIVQEGGERGLNVLFSRARIRCEIFTAIDPDQMDLRHTKSEGLKTLKAFLHFARDGKLPPGTNDEMSRSTPFEDSIASFLRSEGYIVRGRTGSPRCHVNLVVADPRDPDKDLLGILVDGPQYQGGATARERYRLTPEILIDRGWKIHWCWSTVWALNPIEEKTRLLAVLKQAEQGTWTTGTKPRLTPSQRIINRNTDTSDIKLGAGTPYSFGDLKWPEPRKAIEDLSSKSLKNLIKEIINHQSPVHESEILRRVRDLSGQKTLRESQEKIIQEALDDIDENSKGYSRRKMFFYKNDKPIECRDRAGFHSSHKKIEWISPEEISAAILFVVRHSGGISEDDVVKETVRVLGFSDIPKGAVEVIPVSLERLFKDGGLISLEEGKLRYFERVK